MSYEKLKAALQQIARNEIEVFDEDTQGNVLVSMSADEMAEIAYAALAELTREELAASVFPTPAAEKADVELVADALEQKLGPLARELAETAIAALQARSAEPVQDRHGLSAKALVHQWQMEWHASTKSHWADSIAWGTAEEIARRIDEARPAEPAGEKPCRHEWYQGACVHCEITVNDFRARPAAPTNPERLADHIAEFLFAVLLSPGCKRPVEDYYPADHDWSDESAPFPEASWRVCENNAWVECIGSHKWKILPAGEIALYQHRLAALCAAPAQDGKAPRRCIHGNPLGEPCADCDKEAREATA